jgi:hypothetical protein
MTKLISTIALLVLPLSATALSDEKIAWYGNLEDGLRAARLTGKPVFLISAAVQCKGVSGIY